MCQDCLYVEFGKKCDELNALLRTKYNSVLFYQIMPIPIARFFTTDEEGKLIPKHETFAALKLNIDPNAQLEQMQYH